MNKNVLLLAAFVLAASVPAESKDITFAKADANADGKVDKAEFSAAHKASKGDAFDAKKTGQLFKKKDVNKDGFLTAVEMTKKGEKAGKKGTTDKNT